MHSADNEFFEEYKHLEKLCDEKFSCRNGVKEYITLMEKEFEKGQRHVAGWKSDYYTLKHVRWVRNRIAHDTVSARVSAPEDTAFVRDFYARAMHGRDPLALLWRAPRRAKKRKTGKSSALLSRIIRALFIIVILLLLLLLALLLADLLLG